VVPAIALSSTLGTTGSGGSLVRTSGASRDPAVVRIALRCGGSPKWVTNIHLTGADL
jgi:hypothetical protein